MEKRKKDLWIEARETFLQVLLLAYQQSKKFEAEGDMAGKEIVERDVIASYEKLYFSLDGEEIQNFKEEQLITFAQHLQEIQQKHHFTRAWILEQADLREKLRGKSGAEVVKRLLEYQKKELEKQLRSILRRAEEILEQEEKKTVELSNAIQEVDQMKIIEELQPLQREYAKISKNAIEIRKKIDYTVREIEKKWIYEIFGTITEQILKETYMSFQEGH